MLVKNHWNLQLTRSLPCSSSDSTQGWSYCWQRDLIGFVFLSLLKGSPLLVSGPENEAGSPTSEGEFWVLFGLSVHFCHSLRCLVGLLIPSSSLHTLAPSNRRDLGGIGKIPILGAIAIFCYQIFSHKMTVDCSYYSIMQVNTYFNLVWEKSQLC